MRVIAGFDSETTGLEQEEGHRFCELALQLHDLDTGRKIGEWVQRINPERSFDPKSSEIHGIRYEDVVGCPTWESIAPKFATVLSRCDYLVAHNGEHFDAPFVVRELLRVGAPVPELRVVDTMLQGRWATPDGSLPNLEALCFACGVPYDKSLAHAALYDVSVMMDCFFMQYPRGFFTLPTEPFVLPPAKAKKEKK